MATYQQELRNFKEQWKLPDYDLNEYAKNDKGLRYAEAFLTGESVDLSVGGDVVRWFSKTIEAYFKANTSLNADGKYISSFKPQAFFDSFKKLVQAKFDDDAKGKGNATPLQVKDVLQNQKENLEGVMAKNMSQYQKTLPALWAEKMKKGSMTQNDLLLVADNVMYNVDSVLPNNKIGLEDKITNVVAAHEAMKQFRARHSGFLGWLWKVVFRERNEIEKANLELLESQVNRLRTEGYPVDKIAADLTGKTVLGVEVVAKKTEQEPQPKEVKNVQTEVKPLMEPIADKTSALVTNDSIKGKVIDTLKEKMPMDSSGDFMFGFTVQSTGNKFITEKIQPTNEDFDKGVANGNDPKKEMGHVVRKIFVDAMKTMGRMTSYTDSKVKIEAMKIFTKEVVMNFTAAAVNPELGGAVDSYVELNANRYEKIVSEGKDFFDEMEAFEQKLERGLISEEEPVEQVFGGENNPFAEKDGPKSPQVSQALKQNVPTINNSNN